MCHIASNPVPLKTFTQQKTRGAVGSAWRLLQYSQLPGKFTAIFLGVKR